MAKVECPACLGSGKRGYTEVDFDGNLIVHKDHYECSVCHGTGKKPKTRWLGLGKNKKIKEARKKPLPKGLMSAT